MVTLGTAKNQDAFTMKIHLILLFTVVCFAGCQVMKQESKKQVTCTLRLVNNSKQDIIFVKLGNGEFKHDFGFYDAGGGGKTFFGTTINVSSMYPIAWEEKGIDRKAVVDLSVCLEKSFSKLTLAYHGKDRWMAVVE